MKYRYVILSVLFASQFLAAKEGSVTTSLWEIEEELTARSVPTRFEALDGALASAHYISFDIENFSSALPSARIGRIGGSVANVPVLAGQKFEIELPDYREQTILSIHGVREQLPGVLTYAGLVNGDIASATTLTIDESGLLGKIHYKKHTYIISKSDKGDRYVMYSIDKRLLPQSEPTDEQRNALKDLIPKDGRNSGNQQFMSNPDCDNYTPNTDNGNVRILFLHTPSVASGITSLVNQIVSEHNETTWSSGIDHKNYISVADIDEVNDEFDDLCRDTILADMETESGVFSNLDSDMTTVDADLALLIVDEDDDAYIGGFCGGTQGRLGGASRGYEVSDEPHIISTVTYAIGDLTAPHEVGHSLGGTHESESSESLQTGAPDCSRGYIISYDEYQTMQGGYTGAHCGFDPLPGPQDCVRVPVWSNPNISYEGDPAGDSDDAYMGVALNMTYPDVAEWEDTYPYSTPSTPSSAPTVTSQECFGYNVVEWSDPTGVDHHQVYTALSSSPSSWSLAYHGTSTAMIVNVPSGQSMYIKTRSCNGNGCSNFSSTSTASYYGPYCM